MKKSLVDGDYMQSMFPGWILDVTNYDPELPVWCPMTKNGTILFGLTKIGECPGTPTHIMHRDGPEALEFFLDIHPDIKRLFKLD